MENLINKLTEFKKLGQERIESIVTAIREGKKELKQLEEEHHKAVLANNEKESDKLFDKIYDLKRKIEKNEAKFKVFNKSRNITKDIEETANGIIDSASAELKRLKGKENNLEEELEELRETYFKKIEEIGKVLKERDKFQEYLNQANELLNPDYTLRFHFDDQKAHNYKIDKVYLINNALNGTRTEGETR